MLTILTDGYPTLSLLKECFQTVTLKCALGPTVSVFLHLVLFIDGVQFFNEPILVKQRLKMVD